MDKMRLRFEKTGRAIYISHLDMMRTMQRVFARAGLELKYSEGFNPHPQISIALPLSVGTGSLCEIMDFRLTSDTELETLPERMNAVMPEGIRIIEAYEPQRKVSELKWLDVKGIFEYDERDKAAMAVALEEFFARDAIVITKKTKRGMGESDIRPAIKTIGFTVDDAGVIVEATISAQEPTLNPELLAESLRQLAPDIAPDFVQKVKDFIAYLRPTLKEYHEVFTGNVIAQERMKGVGVLSREDAISFGATGGTGRASGWACDTRKRHPYSMYGKVDFKEIVHTEGDSFARYMVRMEEIMESMNIIEQLIDNIPEGAFQQKMKPIIRVPEGSYYAAVEGSRGEFGVFLESRGDKYPYRLKFRATGLPLVSAMETMCRGAKIADLIAIGGTVDYVVPDIDR